MKNALRMVELARASACVVGGGCLVIVGAAATQVHAQAQGYPAKPIRWIVPFPPGGGTDFVSRTLAPKLAEALGQQVVIDNRPGSGGTIGLAIAAKAPADGYHVVTAQTANIAIAPALYRKLGYDALKDFTPITRAVSAPLILVSHPSFPARNVADLIKIARAKPGEITYGSPGNGTGGHLGSEMIKLMAKVDMVHVPYKGASPALTDLLGGQIALYLSSLPPAVPMVKRASSLPDVPTIAESGLPGYAVESWYGVFVPAGTPKDIVTRLNTDLVRILGSNEVRDRLAADGSEATPTKAEEFAAFVRDEHQKWGRVVREARLTVD
jgi:tripartite-type tricarboxylate transporter receptor subunit TctC